MVLRFRYFHIAIISFSVILIIISVILSLVLKPVEAFEPSDKLDLDKIKLDSKVEGDIKYNVWIYQLRKPIPTLSPQEVEQYREKQRIDINKASKSILMIELGINEDIAERIIRYRQEKGKISSIWELSKIKGISKSQLEKWKDYLNLGIVKSKQKEMRKRYSSNNRKPIKSNSGKHKGLKININKADLKELVKLPGIGVKTAEKIIKYRKEKGGFKNIDELIRIKGIGPKKLEKIKPYIRVE